MQKKHLSKIGRPTKYRPEMCNMVTELMRNGISKTELISELDISWDTLARWQKNIPEFSEAIKHGEKLSEAWWMKLGRENLYSKNFNHRLWYINMKNRFSWCDKQDHKITNKKEVCIRQEVDSKKIIETIEKIKKKILAD